MIIPALNEERSIAAVVSAVSDFGVAIVVDDGSTDETAAEATAAGAILVRHDVNRGYDRALNSGFSRADELGLVVVVTVDADGQHRPEQLPQFIGAVEAGADVVAGVRDRRQRLSERLFASLAAWRWGLDDPLCGMKAYRMSFYRGIGHFDSYGSIGTELLLRAARGGAVIAQLPVVTRDRVDRPRFGRLFRANYLILRAMVLGIWMTRGRRA